MKLVLATRNHKKTEEMRRILSGTGLLLKNLEDFPFCPEIAEDGATFQENAEKKALQVSVFTGLAALADDSGLVVDALDGAPGIYSARYAGPNASDADNLEKLLMALRDCPEAAHDRKKRTAHFACVLSLAHPDGRVQSFNGRVDGHIIDAPQGENGFGYDPVFVPEMFDRTFAEMSAAEKDAMSHRGRALAAFSRALQESMEELFGQGRKADF